MRWLRSATVLMLGVPAGDFTATANPASGEQNGGHESEDFEVMRILDVGCGLGHRLPDGVTAAVDIRREAIQRAKAEYPTVAFCVASGERPPSSDSSFDRVTAFVSLPYVDIPAAVAEFARVMSTGCGLQISLHRFPRITEWWFRDIRELNWKGFLFLATVGRVKLLSLSAMGRQFRFPFNRRRMEAFQTKRPIQMVLLHNGFSDIRFCREGRRLIAFATLSLFDPRRAGDRKRA